MAVSFKKLLIITTVLIILCLASYKYKQSSAIPEVSKQETSQNFVFVMWKNNVQEILDYKNIDKIQINRKGKVFKIKDLPPNKQELFKLMLIYKLKKEAIKMEDMTISQENKQFVENVKNKCDEKIAESKQKIYNLNNDTMHAFDKHFLENLDVYFFN